MLDTIKNTNKKILYSIFSAVTIMAVYNLFNPYVAPYLISKGFNREQISFISSLSPLMLIVFIPILETISDLIGRKKILIFSLFTFSVALLAYIFVGHNYLLLIIATLLTTLSYEAFCETQMMRAEDEVTEHRAKFTGYYESFRSVGSIFGSVAGTLIVASLPIANTFKIALALIVILLIAGLFKKSTAKNDRPKIKIRENLNFIKDIRTYLSIKELREVTLLDIAMSFHHPAMTVFIPLFIVQELKLNVKYAGIFTIGLIIGHLFQFAFGYACEVFTTRKVIRRSVLIFAIGLILLAFVQNTGTLIAVSLILGFSGSAWNTSVLCYLAEVGEKRNQGGLILGSYASVAYMSVFVSFLFSGWFVQQYNFRPIFILYGLIAIISLMLTKLIPEKIAQ